MVNLTAEDVFARFDYDREAGAFRRHKGRNAGKIAGTLVHGRRYVRLGAPRYANYHLVWLVETGAWPTLGIDHIDLDMANDRIGNLRLATQAQNLANMRRGRTNTSGFKGVAWDKARGKWLASISIENRFVNLGRFADPQAAHQAYLAAALRRSGEFARGG
jgi:hypothetical protein